MSECDLNREQDKENEDTCALAGWIDLFSDLLVMQRLKEFDTVEKNFETKSENEKV